MKKPSKDKLPSKTRNQQNESLSSQTTKSSKEKLGVEKEISPAQMDLAVSVHFLKQAEDNWDLDGMRKCYSLDLIELIKSLDDTVYEGRVLAYWAPQLVQQKTALSLRTIPFVDYTSYLQIDIPAKQRTKFTAMEEMVKLINSTYCTIKQSKNRHDSFCKLLLQVVDFCMCTQESRFDYHKLTFLDTTTPESKLHHFWDTIILFTNKLVSGENLTHYYAHLKSLIKQFNESILINKQIDDLRKTYEKRKNKGIGVCMSWQYFETICDNANIGYIEDLKHTNKDRLALLDSFTTSYKATCQGLAEEYFYLGDLWDFLVIQKAEHKNCPLYNVLKEVEKMLNTNPRFHECRPEEKKATNPGISRGGPR
jgi:hypothetical protein